MAEIDVRVGGRTQAVHQQVLVRMGIELVGGDLAFGEQLFNVGMIARALHQWLAAKMIQAAVADMGPVGAIFLQQHRHHRAVRFLLAGIRRQRDDGMRFVDDGLQQLLRRIIACAEVLEHLLRGGDHLLRRHRAAGVAAHAVGDHHQHHARLALAWNDDQTVLLLGAITDVLTCSCVDANGHGARLYPAWHRHIPPRNNSCHMAAVYDRDPSSTTGTHGC